MKRILSLLLELSVFIILLGLFIMCKQPTSESDISYKDDLPEPVDPGPFGIQNQNACRVLFIGNSLTYANSLPFMFYKLAEESDKSLYVDQATIPAAQFHHHYRSEFTKRKISSQKWDFVVLQEGVFDIAFPEYDNDTIVFIEYLKQLIFANNSETKILYFLLWSSKEGYNQYTYKEFQEMLRDGTVRIAEKTDLMVAPIGWSWYKVIDKRQDIELFASDGSHPSYNGSYLGACVYFSAIFKESVTNNPYKGIISTPIANYFQEIASNTVLDSLDYWNISDSSISLMYSIKN